LQEELAGAEGLGEIVSRSGAMRATLAQVQRVAPTDTTVLLLGETGTGKEVVARAIHRLSQRHNRPLVRVNCAALPLNLIESELFGHERGAFTGATVKRVGRFEIADGASLFLDEIGELPLELQPKLLRVLQDGEFERLGSSRTIKVNVRVIAATNRNLAECVRNGTFRADLYYRLNVFPIRVPPLRERPEDIEPLTVTFLAEAGRRLGRRFAPAPAVVLDALRQHDWPGNVRELQNVIERAAVTTPGRVLELPAELEPVPVRGKAAGAGGEAPSSNGKAAPPAAPAAPDEVRGGAGKTSDSGNGARSSTSHLTLVDHQREHILAALKLARGRVEGAAGAAAMLGINASTLRSRMKKLGIKRSADS
jgi:transcriptional regulator with GAF, ATPase, and Fis domain